MEEIRLTVNLLKVFLFILLPHNFIKFKFNTKFPRVKDENIGLDETQTVSNI